MRVIAGKYRSRKLDAPRGMDTRPTTDRIKETLFNILQNDVPECTFLDLFAGSGQMGIEALSRGAEHATFVDNSRDAVQTIETNINRLGISEQSTVLDRDVISAIRTLPGDAHFDIVFLDPPYRDERESEVLTALKEQGCIDDDSVVIIEADLHRDFSFAEDLGYTLSRIKKYKTNQHVFLHLKA